MNSLKYSLIIIIESIMLASALSLDAFVASFAYGSRKIKIPFRSIQVINLICSAITGLSLLAGTALKHCIPGWFTVMVSFTILFILGIVKLLDSLIKSFIRRHFNFNKEIKFSFFNIKFILNLYADPEKADIDDSKVLSPMEAASLAIALSLDGITVGIGAAIGNVNGLAIFVSSFVIGMLAVLSGNYTGHKVAGKTNFNLSWISGLILIILAFSKLF